MGPRYECAGPSAPVGPPKIHEGRWVHPADGLPRPQFGRPENPWLTDSHSRRSLRSLLECSCFAFLVARYRSLLEMRLLYSSDRLWVQARFTERLPSSRVASSSVMKGWYSRGGVSRFSLCGTLTGTTRPASSAPGIHTILQKLYLCEKPQPQKTHCKCADVRTSRTLAHCKCADASPKWADDSREP